MVNLFLVQKVATQDTHYFFVTESAKTMQITKLKRIVQQEIYLILGKGVELLPVDKIWFPSAYESRTHDIIF